MAQTLAALQTPAAQPVAQPAACPRCDVPMEVDFHRHWCWHAFQLRLLAERPELERVFDEHDGSERAFSAVLQLTDDLKAIFDAWTPRIRDALHTSVEEADALIARRLEKVIWYVDREIKRQAAIRARAVNTARLRLLKGGAAV